LATSTQCFLLPKLALILLRGIYLVQNGLLYIWKKKLFRVEMCCCWCVKNKNTVHIHAHPFIVHVNWFVWWGVLRALASLIWRASNIQASLQAWPHFLTFHAWKEFLVCHNPLSVLSFAFCLLVKGRKSVQNTKLYFNYKRYLNLL